MKKILITFDDEDFNKLKSKKGKITWEKFVLSLLDDKNKKEDLEEYAID